MENIFKIVIFIKSFVKKFVCAYDKMLLIILPFYNKKI